MLDSRAARGWYSAGGCPSILNAAGRKAPIVVAPKATPQDNATAEPKPIRFVAATITARRGEGVKLRILNVIMGRPPDGNHHPL
jgi:hypothetical protein